MITGIRTYSENAAEFNFVDILNNNNDDGQFEGTLIFFFTMSEFVLIVTGLKIVKASSLGGN